MKRSIKTFAILAAMTVIGSTALFAHPAKKSVKNHHAFEMPAPKNDNVKTIAATVKVTNKKDVKNIYLKTKDGKIYVADAMGPEGKKAIDILLNRNGKKAVVSGVLNEDTGVFNIFKMGNIDRPGDENRDEK